MSCSHTISLYSLAHCLAALALSRSHTESRSLSHQLPHGTWYHPLSTSHTVSLYSECIRQTVCRATGQPSVQRTDTEPRTVRRTNERQVTSTAACCAAAAHTLFCQPLLHYCCTKQHTAHHTDHCCTTTAPYSTPLVTPTSVAPTTVAPTTAALAVLHHTLSVSPNKHNHSVANCSSLPQMIHSLAFLFFSSIVIIAHSISPYKNFMPTIVLCKYVLAIALVRIVLLGSLCCESKP